MQIRFFILESVHLHLLLVSESDFVEERKSLFQIGLLQQVQHRLGGTLAIITFKADHKIAPFRFNRSLRAEYPTAYLSIIKSVPFFVKKALCRKAAAAAYREQNKKSGRFLASARIFNKFSGYRG